MESGTTILKLFFAGIMGCEQRFQILAVFQDLTIRLGQEMIQVMCYVFYHLLETFYLVLKKQTIFWTNDVRKRIMVCAS